MPYSQKAHNFFQLCAHNPEKAHGKCPSKADSRKMAAEGVKKRKFPKKDRRGFY